MSNKILDLGCTLQGWMDQTRKLDFLAPLALRLYLAPIFWMVGQNKLSHFDDTAAWFGNPDWGLGLPMPELMAGLATGTEILGGVMLLLGLGVRWISIPLMITMVVAALTVHLENGWLAIADKTLFLFSSARVEEGLIRLDRAKEILQEYGDYDWLTEYGTFVMNNNGIEFAATYFIMLLALLFLGGGRYVSVDYWIRRKACPEQ